MEQKRILITGGTSGLGRQLALRFLKRGFSVIVTGRNNFIGASENLDFIGCDFADFSSVVLCAETIVRKVPKLDILVNNAGILSPASYTETINGFETSHQVNFLSHVLLTTLLQQSGLLQAARIVNLSSPIYKMGTLDSEKISNRRNYEAFQSYSNSKLFMALFSAKLAAEGLDSFSFDPGTFRSGIYRAREKWFHVLYKIAAPFMISASSVAEKLVNLILSDNFFTGKMVNKRGVERRMTSHDVEQLKLFWGNVDRTLTDHLVR
jgi:NAD(P)-dependent dehydrogenase (short-subunit alcohol dehydrogenase family)